MKRILLILLAIIINSSLAMAYNAADIKQILQKYCIPKPNDIAYDEVSVCTSVLESVYNSIGPTCSCWDDERLVYDPELRRCKPRCPGGYVPKRVNGCQAGNFMYKMKKVIPGGIE